MTDRKRRWRRIALGTLVLFGVAVAVAVADGWRSFGRRAEGARRDRMEHSAQWQDGAFENPQPIVNDYGSMLSGLFGGSDHVSPDGPLPAVDVDPALFATPPTSGLRVTWFGHSSMLVEIDGHRVLTDPIWSDRPSPFTWAGPERWNPPLVALDALPAVDAVIVSHDHYDHLDRATIEAMKDWDTTFVVPLGVGAHLEYWGVPRSHIAELDWWERATLGDLDIVCTPARHASGRTLLDKDATLWASYSLLGPAHRVFYSGDTGMFPGMREIGARFGPFDLTMIETGQYDAAWPDWHIGPEQAVEAHGMLRGRTLLPVHWGLFALAHHGWTEPVERALAAAAAQGATIVAPRPGESFEPAPPPPVARWWPDVPWQTAAEAPIVSSQL